MRSWRKSTGPRDTSLMYNAISSTTGTITGNATTMINGSRTLFQDGTAPSGDKKSAETKSIIFNSINWALLPKPGELGRVLLLLPPFVKRFLEQLENREIPRLFLGFREASIRVRTSSPALPVPSTSPQCPPRDW